MSGFFLKIERSFALLALLACLSAGLCVPAPAQPWNVLKGYYFQNLYSFSADNGQNSDGAQPQAGLILDNTGGLYGTTMLGGANGGGTIFKLWLPSNVFTPLASLDNATGEQPTAGLVTDGFGNFYGTTTTSASAQNVYGSIFVCIPAAQQIYALYSFQNGSDGLYPFNGVIMDGNANLYGTTYPSYLNNTGGSIFEYSLSTSTFRTLYTFSNPTLTSSGLYENSDGYVPSGLILDKQGNLYGAAGSGGTNGNGTIFKYYPPTNTFTTLYTFSAATTNGTGYQFNSDGVAPLGVVMDSNGDLYGAAIGGGTNGTGTLFKFSPATKTFTTLYSFSAQNNNHDNSDGVSPRANIILDAAGNLYGTTTQGGISDNGTVFKFSPATNTFTTLHSFTGTDANTGYSNADGATPWAPLLIDGSGNLYGTTEFGGANGTGVIFALHPIYEIQPPNSLHSPQGGNGVSGTPGGGVNLPTP